MFIDIPKLIAYKTEDSFNSTDRNLNYEKKLNLSSHEPRHPLLDLKKTLNKYSRTAYLVSLLVSHIKNIKLLEDKCKNNNFKP